MAHAEFTTSPLETPVNYAEVAEGHFLAASPTEQYDHLVTFGIYTCKGIVLHNPATQHGVLAHLDGTTKFDRTLDTAIDAYGDDLSTADIKIVQATVDEDTFLWPSIESLANFFMQHNPRSLALDVNHGQLAARGIALNLRTGSLHDTDYNHPLMQQSRRILKPSVPLRPSTSAMTL